MKRVIAIAVIALSLAACGTTYKATPADEDRPPKCFAVSKKTSSFLNPGERHDLGTFCHREVP